MYKIIMVSWGGTERLFMDGLTYKDAVSLCECYGWQIDEGYIWDLEIKPSEDDGWDRWEVEPSRDDWDTDEDY